MTILLPWTTFRINISCNRICTHPSSLQLHEHRTNSSFFMYSVSYITHAWSPWKWVTRPCSPWAYTHPRPDSMPTVNAWELGDGYNAAECVPGNWRGWWVMSKRRIAEQEAHPSGTNMWPSGVVCWGFSMRLIANKERYYQLVQHMNIYFPTVLFLSCCRGFYDTCRALDLNDKHVQHELEAGEGVPASSLFLKASSLSAFFLW